MVQDLFGEENTFLYLIVTMFVGPVVITLLQLIIQVCAHCVPTDAQNHCARTASGVSCHQATSAPLCRRPSHSRVSSTHQRKPKAGPHPLPKQTRAIAAA